MILVTAGCPNGMSNVTCQISISLDGFVAGPNQSLENPIGEGGLRLHEWVFATASWRQQQGQSGGGDSLGPGGAGGALGKFWAYNNGPEVVGGGQGRGGWGGQGRGGARPPPPRPGLLSHP